MKNILITSAGRRVVLVRIFKKTIEELGEDIKVFTTDTNLRLAPTTLVSDESFKVSSCTDDCYVDELLKVCLEKDIGVIIPTIDTELLVLSGNRQRFYEHGVELVLSDMDFVRVCRDKRLTGLFFADRGVPVPYPIDKLHPKFKMFAKPYDGSGSQNTHIIRNGDELTKEIMDDPKLMFMEYVDRNDYKEYTIDMYYGRDHKVKGIVPRERIEIRTGETSKGLTRRNYIQDYLKERMGELPGVRGGICLQLFYRERDHDIKGIEINPRFGGGYPLSYYAGANFAEYIIREYLMGESVEYSDEWLDHTLMLRYDDNIIVYNAEV